MIKLIILDLEIQKHVYDQRENLCSTVLDISNAVAFTASQLSIFHIYPAISKFPGIQELPGISH